MDFLMIENGDGGELDIVPEGDLIVDETYYTAAYLSLFEGDTFYKKFHFQVNDNVNIETEFSKPATPDNLKNLSNIIILKLNWMIENGLAKNITADALPKENNITEVLISVVQPDNNVETFKIIWDRAKSELKRFGEIYERI